jgi:DNA polymerase III epsilon subunit family exonuclease
MTVPDPQGTHGGPPPHATRDEAFAATRQHWGPAEDAMDRSVDALPERVVYSEGDDETAVVPPPGPRTPASPGRWRQPAADVPAVTAEDMARDETRARERARDHLHRLARRRRRPDDSEWMHRALSTLPVCVIDLETTGGRHDNDEILEVGAVLLRGAECVREFSTLVDPQRPITAAAHRVHRIGAADVVGAPRVHELLPWIRELAAHRVLLFHNAGFDLGFLQRAFAEAEQEPLRQPVIDTVVVARRLMGGRCGLGRLGQRLGIDLPHAHRALADARLTAQVWGRLCDYLVAAGATRLAEVPGVVARASRHRRRVRPRHRELLQTLQAAIVTGTCLELAYRTTAGSEPHLLQVRPLRILHNRVCRVQDLERGHSADLWLDRIDSCRPADPHRADACVEPGHGV